MRLFKTSILAGLAFAAAGAAAVPAGAQGPSAAAGQQAFEQTCAACHQPDGKGIPDAFPALAGSAFAQGDAHAVIKTVLDGRNAMPSFRADLSDDQLASILTYVRSAWGNTAPAVSKDQVAAARAEAKP